MENPFLDDDEGDPDLDELDELAANAWGATDKLLDRITRRLQAAERRLLAHEEALANHDVRLAEIDKNFARLGDWQTRLLRWVNDTHDWRQSVEAILTPGNPELPPAPQIERTLGRAVADEALRRGRERGSKDPITWDEARGIIGALAGFPIGEQRYRRMLRDEHDPNREIQPALCSYLRIDPDELDELIEASRRSRQNDKNRPAPETGDGPHA